MRKMQNGELKQVVCNQCGRELRLEKGILREGCFSADTLFGYFSSRDGIRQRFDLCEECYEKLIESFCIPVEETAETELL